MNREKDVLREIREKSRDQYRNQDDILADYTERCIPDLERILTKILSDPAQVDSLTNSQNGIDDNDAETRVDKVRNYLQHGNFIEVAKYIIQLDSLVGHQDKWKCMRVNEQVLYFITLLRTYLFDDYVS